MAKRDIDLETLGTYVDGELDVEDRARVAEAIADDPKLARQVMVLSRLKSAVADAVDVQPVSLPPIPVLRNARRMAIAVFAVAAVGLGALYWQWVSPRNLAEDVMLAAAHASWLSGTDIASTGALSRPVHASAAFANVYVPDLTASRLKIAHVGLSTLAERDRLVVGYEGTRGCRITLIVHEVSPGKAGDLTDTPLVWKRDGKLLAKWRVGGLDYAMVSSGMTRKRFDLIVDNVAAATVRHAPFNTDVRTALAESRAQSKPCASA